MADAGAGRHFSGLNTRLVVEHVRFQLGDAGVQAVLADAGELRSVAVLCDDASWSTYDQFRRLLEAASTHLADVGGFAGMGDARYITSATSPEYAATMQALGSPEALLLSSPATSAAIYPICRNTAEKLGPAHIALRRRLDGFEPFPELCAFMAALVPVSVHLFGLEVLESSEVTCQCRGDEECTQIIRWDESESLTRQLEFTKMKLALTESRMAGFLETVGDIVSTEDLDVVLGRIVRNAARAMQGEGFVLALEGLSGTSRIYTDGIGPDVAADLLHDDARVLSVDVASTHRRYGRLVIADPTESLGFQLGSLETYARLAATALDSAFALEEARRQAKAATTMLELSTALAEPSTPEGLAALVAAAMPNVIDCDCAALIFSDGSLGRIAAHVGYEGEEAVAMDNLEIPGDIRMLQGVMRYRSNETDAFGQELMTAWGLEASACAGITVDEDLYLVLIASVRHGGERIMDDPRLDERFAGLAGQAAVALRNGRLLDAIRHQSLHDPLTSLPNRALLMDRATQMLGRVRRDHAPAAALFIDLDGFKEINDTLGHAAGDELLQMVAGRLTATVRGSDTVGRLGGDEFVVLAEGPSLAMGVEVLARRLLDVIREPFHLVVHDRTVVVAASIGVALGDRASASELLRDADTALYEAKAEGKGCFRIFGQGVQDRADLRAKLDAGMAAAFRNDEFFLLFQPTINLDTDAVTGAEALLRWAHPQRGVIPPDDFVPLLEEAGLMVDVGRWVLEEACLQASRWHAAGHRLDVSVNLSERQLEQSNFVDVVQCVLDRSRLPASSLILELKESVIMRDTTASTAVLKSLKQLGVRIAIDDFGTAYSSLAYLRRFSVDAIKIDRTIVDEVNSSPAARDLVHTLVRLAKALDLETLAEGIEHPAQRSRLQDEHCDTGQGFLFARPLASEAFLDLLVKQGATVGRRS